MSRPRLYNLLGIAVVVVIWVSFVPSGGVFVSSFREVASAYADLAVNGNLVPDIIDSVKRVLVGVFAAFAIGAILAVLSFFARPFGHFVNGPVELTRPVPPIAWVPVAIVIFGIGDAPAVAIVALGAFFPIWLSLFKGISEVREQHLLAARSLGATPFQCFARIVVPSIMPNVFHGLRLGVGLGWFCVVAAEMMGAQTGLGFGVQLYSLNLEISRTYSYILTIGLIGFVLNYVIAGIEARVCRWHMLEIAS